MGFWGNLWDGVCSAVSSVSSAISSACSAVWNGIKTVASGVASFVKETCTKIAEVCQSPLVQALMCAIAPLATAISGVLGKVITVVRALATALNILSPNENKPENKFENLAQAAEQCATKSKDFDSINAYIEHLREEIRSGNVKLDKELSETELLGYQAMGCAMVIKAVDEKRGQKSSNEFWQAVGYAEIKPEEAKAMLDTAKETGVSDRDMAVYICGTGEKLESTPAEVESAVKASLEKTEPEKSELDKRFDAIISLVEEKLAKQNDEKKEKSDEK